MGCGGRGIHRWDEDGVVGNCQNRWWAAVVGRLGWNWGEVDAGFGGLAKEDWVDWVEVEVVVDDTDERELNWGQCTYYWPHLELWSSPTHSPATV